MSRVRTVGIAAALAVSGLVAALAAGPAAASISGPCTASIAGEDVTNRSTGPTSDPIVVKKDASVPVSMSAKAPITHMKIQIGFGGIMWTVRDKASHGTSWSHSVAVHKYAKYGVGLYKVTGSSSGGVSCSGTALVRVEGSPLSSVAGIVALIATIIGGGGIAGLGLLAARGGSLGVSRSLLALLAGLLGGLGLLVLLQQAAVLYPTGALAIVFVVGGPVLGVGVGWLAHLLGSHGSRVAPA
ncbi:MAG: hypothetical protein ACXVZP_06260 [Gaiellaceae bacterium]